jgi:serine/threonine protein kinase/WD40 repeat protein
MLMQASNLIGSNRLPALQAEFANDDVEVAPRQIASELVARGVLTAWQSHRLLNGHSSFFLGRYRLLDVLGRGGMGIVFKAEHDSMKREVALKVLSTRLMHDPVSVSRFYREIQAVAALDHPNIVRAFDADCVGETHFLVTEYVHGLNLSVFRKRLGLLPVGMACEFIRQTALGLQHAHEQGMVHRDIKPANLLITLPDHSNPTQAGTVRILDLGLSRFTTESSAEPELTTSEQIMGTPDYMSPEQARKSKQADIRSDIYSLGCTLFLLLTGRRPFAGETVMDRLVVRITEDAPDIQTLRTDLPEGLSQVVTHMLARNPNDRFQTPGEVAVALKPFAAFPDNLADVLRDCVAGPEETDAASACDDDSELDHFLDTLSHPTSADTGRTVPDQTAPRLPTGESNDSRSTDTSRGARTKFFAIVAIVFTLASVVTPIWFHLIGRTTLIVDWPEDERASGTLSVDGTQHPLPLRGELRFASQSPERTVSLQRDGYEPVVESWSLKRGVSKTYRPTWIPTAGTRRTQALLELQRRTAALFFDSPQATPVLFADRSAIITARRDLLNFASEWNDTPEAAEATRLCERLPSATDLLSRGDIDFDLLRQAQQHAGNELTQHVAIFVPDPDALSDGPDGKPTFPGSAMTSVKFAPDGNRLYAAGSSGTVIGWELPDRTQVMQWKTRLRVESLSVHPGGRLLAVSGNWPDSSMRLWNLQSAQPLQMPSIAQTTGESFNSAYSSDGRFLMSTGQDPALIVRSATGHQVIHSLPRGSNETPTCGAISPNGKWVAIGYTPRQGLGGVRIWDTANGQVLHDFDADNAPVGTITFSPDSNTLATGGPRGQIRLFDVATAKWTGLCHGLIFGGHANTARILGIDYHQGGRRIATSANEGTVRLWDLDRGEIGPAGCTEYSQRQIDLFPPDGSIHDVAWSPDGQHLATANGNGTIYVLRPLRRH